MKRREKRTFDRSRLDLRKLPIPERCNAIVGLHALALLAFGDMAEEFSRMLEKDEKQLAAMNRATPKRRRRRNLRD